MTAASFPAFLFSRNITVKNGPYTIATFLADATGKCVKKISESWPGDQRVHMRFDSDTGRVLVIGDQMTARMTQVSFSPTTGPSVPSLGAPIVLLAETALGVPADLEAGGWAGGGDADPEISPDGTQILFQRGYFNDDSEPDSYLDTFWTCGLTYDAAGIVEPIDTASCVEVHRVPVNDDNNWGAHAGWGVKPGTIYVVQPSSMDRSQLSLHRLTLAPPAAPEFSEIFRNGSVFDFVRATATDDPAVASGELVAVYDMRRPPNWCGRVYVIDAYDCGENGSCTVLNNQGQGNFLRSVTWLPDGRVTGQGETGPSRQGRCLSSDSLSAFPPIDPYGTPATELTKGGTIEGASGGW